MLWKTYNSDSTPTDFLNTEELFQIEVISQLLRDRK